MNAGVLTVDPAPSLKIRRPDLGLQEARTGRAVRWINVSKGGNEEEQPIDLQFVDSIDINCPIER